jgi:hypothetical protein
MLAFFGSQSVPIKFPMGSENVPQNILSSRLYSISFALSYILVTYITSTKGEYSISIFGLSKA